MKISDLGVILKENFDIKDPGEYDQEGDMAQRQLLTAKDAADELRSILHADENLPEWVQKKISLAVDYLDTVRDYMKSTKRQEMDEAAKKGLYYYVNKRKKAGTSRSKNHPDAPSPQDWKNAAKTAKKESVSEEKIKGVDGKACWPGKRYAGKEKKADGTYKDICVPVKGKKK